VTPEPTPEPVLTPEQRALVEALIEAITTGRNGCTVSSDGGTNYTVHMEVNGEDRPVAYYGWDGLSVAGARGSGFRLARKDLERLIDADTVRRQTADTDRRHRNVALIMGETDA